MKNVNNITILFVDDEESILKLLKLFMRNEPYQTFFVDNGIDALKILSTEQVDIIITDLQMEQINGVALLKQVKSEYPEIIRIILSGIEDMEQIIEIINTAEVYRFISKPLELKSFRRIILEVVVMAQQIRDRNRFMQEAQARLSMNGKMASVGQLAAGIAHELNNPINFVNINLVTLNESFADIVNILKDYRQLAATMEEEKICSPALENIIKKESDMRIDLILEDIPLIFKESESGLERIKKITECMRDFSYVDHRDMKSLADINKCIERALVIAENAYKYHADVETDLGEPKEILCYPEQLNQVFLNLIINSAHAIESQNRREKGLIKIRTWYDSRCVHCQISDNGTGIPAEICSRVFEPFFTTKPPGQATGLGLSIAYDIIVKRHKGELEVSSIEGGGTTFDLLIPVDIKTFEE